MCKQALGVEKFLFFSKNKDFNLLNQIDWEEEEKKKKSCIKKVWV